MCEQKETIWYDAKICLVCDGLQSDVCGACGGSGCSASGNRPDDNGPWITCGVCGGTGSVDCSDCLGSGEREPVCPTCDAPVACWRYDENETKCCNVCNLEPCWREKLGERLYADVYLAILKNGLDIKGACELQDLVDTFVESLCDKIGEQNDDE